jgi:hypothetical protein
MVRLVLVPAVALAAALIAAPVSFSNAATTKLGCVIGKEKWDATMGKCVPATKEPKKTSAKKKTKAPPAAK